MTNVNYLRYFVLLIAVSLLAATGCRSAVATTTEVVAVRAGAVPANPAGSAWDDAPEHPAKWLLQDLVEPRLMNPSTQGVRVRAITNGTEIAFRLEWADATKNDLAGPAKFIDACAVQIPVKIEPNVPAPHMGEEGKTVEITYWRSDWQATVDGRPDSIKQHYPNASVDHYPYEARSLEKGSAAQGEMAGRYAPARALDNRRTGPRETPVEDLIAEGPGTLKPAPPAGSKGRGVRADDGWSVVITRKVPDGLTPGGRTQIAFAVWEGAHNEVAARKKGLFHSIFGPGGPAPGREVSYREWAQPGYLMAELTSYYEAFAFQPATGEVPDHVSVETGFVAYLRLKEAYALLNSDAVHASVTSEAARQFIDDHLSTMAEPLANSLEHSGVKYLSLAGAALLRRTGPRRDSGRGKGLPVISESGFSGDDAPEFACG
jgi:hypothetical protein